MALTPPTDLIVICMIFKASSRLVPFIQRRQSSCGTNGTYTKKIVPNVGLPLSDVFQ